MQSYVQIQQPAIIDEIEEKFEVLDEKNIFKERVRSSFCNELATVSTRAMKNVYRNPISARIRFLQTIIISILVPLIFWDLDFGESGVYGKVGCIFFITSNQLISAMYSVCMLFIVERPVFLREYANGSYSVLSYYLSKSLVEVPFQFIFPIIVSTCIYFLVGFTRTAEKFFTFMAITVMVTFLATSIGFFNASVFKSEAMVIACTMYLILPFMIFSGYVVNLDSVYVWLRWLQY